VSTATRVHEKTAEVSMFISIADVLPCLVLFAILAVAHEVGFRIGRGSSRVSEGERSEMSTLEGGMLGLLGLLLAFTFAMASQRFDARKQLVLEEANAIGTAYLRATAVPGGQPVAELLRRYVDVRLKGGGSVPNSDDFRQAVVESERLHHEIWSRAAALAQANPDPLRALLLVAVNEVIDLHEKRLTALRNHVPTIILVLRLLVTVLVMVSIGHAAGVSGGRSLSTALTFAVLVTMVIMVIIDLDRPERGLIRVSQQSLQTLRESLNRGSQ
jgi:hypothetical protein